MNEQAPAQNGSTKPVNLEAIRRHPPLNLSRTEAAAYLGISLRTLSDLLAKRVLKAVRIGDRRILRLRDLESFLEARAN